VQHAADLWLLPPLLQLAPWLLHTLQLGLGQSPAVRAQEPAAAAAGAVGGAAAGVARAAAAALPMQRAVHLLLIAYRCPLPPSCLLTLPDLPGVAAAAAAEQRHAAAAVAAACWLHLQQPCLPLLLLDLLHCQMQLQQTRRAAVAAACLPCLLGRALLPAAAAAAAAAATVDSPWRAA
jgi:hypothetical protein